MIYLIYSVRKKMLEKLLNKVFFVNCLNKFLDDSMDKLMDQNCMKETHLVESWGWTTLNSKEFHKRFQTLTSTSREFPG